MQSHTTAVREVLQWTTEMSRIREARESELGEAPANRLAQFKEAVTRLQQVTEEDVSTAIGKVAEVDRAECKKRLDEDKTLDKWDAFIARNRTTRARDKDFQAADELLRRAKSSKDPLEVRALLAEARSLLWKADAAETPESKIPAVPSGASARLIDPAKATAALKRKDLRKHIARNDTWGNFDPDKALGSDASEQDLKVFLNVIESAIQADEQDAKWKAYEEKAAEAIRKRPGHDKSKPLKVYKEIVLGAGASAAYYIASNFGKFDIPSTMVLGTLQPWSQERGKDGKVNHPHNMIDPEQGGKPIEDDGLADRAEFSKRIAEVIAKVPHTQAKVTKVTRCNGDFFEAETDQGRFYAKKVTNALGIGKQKVPPGPVDDKVKDGVKDMDSFKRSLDGGQSIKDAYPKVKSIAVVGGNAAIDVITAILRDKNMEADEKLDIHWLVGESGPPAFLKGTDNALAAKAYPDGEFNDKPIKKGNITAYKGYFAGATGEPGKGHIVVSYTCAKKPMPAFTVDLVVYGVGPDVEAMQKMFVDETEGGDPTAPPQMELDPVFDQDRHYNVEVEEKDPAKLVEKLKDRMPKDKETAEKFLRYLEDPSLKDVKDNEDEVMLGVKSKDAEGSESSMQFVGASAARVKTTPAQGKGKSALPLSPPKALHEAVSSLPENVVGNDQLAAARSRIDAQFNALPTSKDDIPLVTKPGGVNFITSNQTVIRVHIAQCYPNIPAGLGDYLTQQIIHARSLRPGKGDQTRTPVPVPGKHDDKFENMSLQQQVAFQEEWARRLQEMGAGMLPAKAS